MQAEQLPGLVDALLSRHNLSFLSLKAIAITTGPGSFTGNRIGLSYAYGLKIALRQQHQLSILPFTTLECLAARMVTSRLSDSIFATAAAANAAASSTTKAETEIVCFLPAGLTTYYCCSYTISSSFNTAAAPSSSSPPLRCRHRLNPLSPPAIVSKEQLSAILNPMDLAAAPPSALAQQLNHSQPLPLSAPHLFIGYCPELGFHDTPTALDIAAALSLNAGTVASTTTDAAADLDHDFPAPFYLQEPRLGSKPSEQRADNR